MAKAIDVRLQDAEGKVYRWRIRRISEAWHLVLGENPRTISGWEYTDHEGYARFSEGNWLALVWHFKQTAANYGLSLISELS